MLYSDPVGSDFCGSPEAKLHYQLLMDRQYNAAAIKANSAITLPEAFSNVGNASDIGHHTVSWIAYPRLATASNSEIDGDRFNLQEEYVEWDTKRSPSGRIREIIFTTEFPEYYQALAAAGSHVLVQGIRRLYPDADPSMEELFGPGFDPASKTAEERAAKFREHIRENPWNNGEKGILCLGMTVNSLGALFGLLIACGVVRTDTDPTGVCSLVGGACVDGRNSDPVVCEASQSLAQSRRAFTLRDPAGIRILKLDGLWKINGQQFEINDQSSNKGTWRIERNGRRGILTVKDGLTLVDDPLTSGADAATKLVVGADVISAPEAAIPAWARTGQESSRRIPA